MNNFNIDSNGLKAFLRLPCGLKTIFAMISMTCYLKQAYDKANKEVSFESLINKLCLPETSEELQNEFVFICKSFYRFDDIYNSYGLKTATDIKIEIQKILKDELPF